MAGGSLPRFTAHAHKSSDNLQSQIHSDSRLSSQDPPCIPSTLASTSVRAQLGAMYSRNEGLLLIAGAQWFFALMNLGVKLLTLLDKPVPTLEAVTYICCFIYVHWKQVPHPILGPPEVRGWLVLRGFTGVYYSLQYLSLSDATAITFLSPSTIAFCGFLFLHETWAFREAMAGLFALLGVLFIARPESIFGRPSTSDLPLEKATPAQRLVAVGFALIGVLGVTGAMISLRIIGKRAHPMHSMIYFSAWCVLAACVGSMTVVHEPWVLSTNWRWISGLVGIGASGFIAQVLLTLGLQKETASRGSIALYSQGRALLRHPPPY
ncbi:hypothetical protein BS47DRAFT_1351246 [Hydnum rufescens UP504]|uniref:EamA domain-containing protein n=1 Tax=Hydnum rufescens UP504 TaxID=1448309 RepID=A0A9P6AKS2_9AGAM|nr:hypothetical protein BS47DRAFT_1351246 [Hydnum rufescens UP504]